MLEQRHLAHRRRQHRSVRQRRYLVTEISTRNNRPRCPSHSISLRRAYPYQRYAHSGHRGPRAARNQRHQRTDNARHKQEQRRRNHLHPVIYHRRHYPAHHPAARNGSNQKQYYHRRPYGLDIIAYGSVYLAPPHPIAYHRYRHSHTRRKEQHRLARTVYCVRAELTDNQHLQHHQHRKRHQRDKPMYSWNILFHLHSLSSFNAIAHNLLHPSGKKTPTPNRPILSAPVALLAPPAASTQCPQWASLPTPSIKPQRNKKFPFAIGHFHPQKTHNRPKSFPFCRPDEGPLKVRCRFDVGSLLLRPQNPPTSPPSANLHRSFSQPQLAPLPHTNEC